MKIPEKGFKGNGEKIQVSILLASVTTTEHLVPMQNSSRYRPNKVNEVATERPTKRCNS